MRATRPDVPRGAATAGDGIVLVDKPAGLSSHDVVALTRRLAATRKVGHAGTLDPMATGLLVLGVGRATRLLTYLVGADKTYEATVRLGQETTTEDAEGGVTTARGCRIDDLPAARLDEALDRLTGPIQQVPSAVSAIRVDGMRSYERVRRGQDVELAARSVTIHALELRGRPRAAVAVNGNGTVGAAGEAGSVGSVGAADTVEVVDIDLRVACSSGTYVRAIARDLGAALGCGAHLTALRRTRVGPFGVDEAATLGALSARVESDAAAARPRGLSVLPVPTAARRCFEAVELTGSEARALGHGQFLPASLLDRARAPEHPIVPTAAVPAGSATPAGRRRVTAGFAPDGAVVALLAREGARARPVLVLAPA